MAQREPGEGEGDVYFYKLSPGASELHGPLSLASLTDALRRGDVDGLALVMSPLLGPDFLPLAEVPALRAAAFAAGAADSEWDDKGAGEGSGTVSVAAPFLAEAGAGAAPRTDASPSSLALPSASYFYAEAGAGDIGRCGPVPAEAFSSLLSAGYVTAETLVWAPALTGWRLLRDVPPLAALLTALGDRGPVAPTPVPDADVQPALGDGNDDGAGENDDDNGHDVAGNDIGDNEYPPADPSRRAKKRARSRDGGNGECEGEDEGDNVSGSGGGGGLQTAAGKRKRKRKGGRPRERVNAWVYVTGLPPDATTDELAVHFKRAGILKADAVTSAPRVRIYREADGAGEYGEAKGDASLCFLRPESVELAVQLLDGVELRPGFPLAVEPASFTAKGSGEAVDSAAVAGAGVGAGSGAGEADARGAGARREPGSMASGKRRAPTPIEQAARLRALEQQVQLSWADEGDEAGAGLCIVVLRNMFGRGEAASGEADFADELRADVAPELEARCGALAKLTVFARHAEGVVVAKFREPGGAAACIEAMNGRFFGGRRVACSYWDGREDFRCKEDESAAERREASFGDWLESS